MNPLFGKKVVFSIDLKNAEKSAIQNGLLEETLIQNAATVLSKYLLELISLKKIKKVKLLAGKGNNSADGLSTLLLLNRSKIPVEIFTPFEEKERSFFCKKFFNECLDKKIKITFIQKKEDFIIEKNDLILDGLFGISYSGVLEEKIKEIIEFVNQSKALIIAIDIPSGLNPDTGRVETAAIKAFETVTFSLPKLGFYINDGPNFTGNVLIKDIGLLEKDLDVIKSSYYLINESEIKNDLPQVLKKRHKYDAGYVIGIAGSLGMSGAANLAGLAALRAGAGIVRIFSSSPLEKAPYELITSMLSLDDTKKLEEELLRAKSLFIGPGIGRSDAIFKLLKNLLPKITLPCVIDADALYFYSQNKEVAFPKNSILTPHKKEMLRLLQKESLKDEELLLACKDFSKKNQVILVLKGYPTFIFHPQEETLLSTKGSPLMATAGVGDVLTGMIAALLTQKNAYEAAILGVFLHAFAGELGALEKGYGMIASDLIEKIPEAFKKTFIKEKMEN